MKTNHKRNLSYSQALSTDAQSSYFKRGAASIITNSSIDLSKDISSSGIQNKLYTQKNISRIETGKSSSKTKSPILQKDFNGSPGVYILM